MGRAEKAEHDCVGISIAGLEIGSGAGSEAGFVAMCAGVGAGVVCGRVNA